MSGLTATQVSGRPTPVAQLFELSTRNLSVHGPKISKRPASARVGNGQSRQAPTRQRNDEIETITDLHTVQFHVRRIRVKSHYAMVLAPGCRTRGCVAPPPRSRFLSRRSRRKPHSGAHRPTSQAPLHGLADARSCERTLPDTVPNSGQRTNAGSCSTRPPGTWLWTLPPPPRTTFTERHRESHCDRCRRWLERFCRTFRRGPPDPPHQGGGRGRPPRLSSEAQRHR
jgi:hypothetical protein